MTPGPREQQAREELDAALEALDEISSAVGAGQSGSQVGVDRIRQLAYLWIVVGSRLKNYCEVLGIPRASGEFADAIDFRHVLAYRRPSRLSVEVVWRTSVEDAPSLRRAIDEARDALDPG